MKIQEKSLNNVQFVLKHCRRHREIYNKSQKQQFTIHLEFKFRSRRRIREENQRSF